MTGSAPSAPPRPLATVGALVFNDAGDALFIKTHKWGGRWAVPGGKIDYGERIHAALLREFREETGLELVDVRWAPTLESVESSEFHKPAHFILLNFTARTHGTHVTLNDEAQDHTWLTPHAALQTLDLNRATHDLTAYAAAHGHSGPLVTQAAAPEPRAPDAAGTAGSSNVQGTS